MDDTRKKVVHGNPIDKENNLLDRMSNMERLNYFATHFLETETALVKERIRPIVPRGTVLNVGCGRLGTERTFFPEGDYDVLGIDVNEEGLRILAGRQTYTALARGSIASLPLASGSCDAIYLRLMLHHLVYPRNILAEGLDECFRVLRPGGVLALVEPSSWHPVGAMMNLAHALRLDMYVHGTNDDIALSPRRLWKRLAKHSSRISTHVIAYGWRRLPIPVNAFIDRLHARTRRLSDRVPFFGHTLMMVAVKD